MRSWYWVESCRIETCVQRVSKGKGEFWVHSCNECDLPWMFAKHIVVVQSCLTLRDPMNCNTTGFPVLHYLLEFTQTHVHWVGDAIQPCHPLLSPSPLAVNLSQQQGLCQWVSSWYMPNVCLKLVLREGFSGIFRVHPNVRYHSPYNSFDKAECPSLPADHYLLLIPVHLVVPLDTGLSLFPQMISLKKT